MKKSLLLALLITPLLSAAQGGTWTWISGTNTGGSLGVYGTQGVPSINNHPPGLYEYAEWKDLQGNFWVYGGWDPNYSDLWKFDPVTLEWTWVKGNAAIGQLAVYGTQGVPDPANTPGQRPSASCTWVDQNGFLWLFGGNGSCNDLWKYDISTNEWAWMKGSTAPGAFGSHGTLGVPLPSNLPGGRTETASSWTDSTNHLWLFGGNGMDDFGNGGTLNDLWKYDIGTNEWTWMSGSSGVNAPSSYGVKGVASPTNAPGGRLSYTRWQDLQGNLWLFGGYDWTGNVYNDMWKYDPVTSQWTWMSGTDIAGDAGVYSANCVFDTVNIPASRVEQRSGATDRCGRCWLFGGNYFFNNAYLNDLWVFDPAQVKWNWLSGTNIGNQVGNYGTKGVPSPTNIPPSRWGAVSWWGNDDKFYLFAGTQQNTTNNYCDMWVFDPDPSCISPCVIIPIAAFTAPHHLCPGVCTDFTNLSINGTTFQWFFPGAFPDTSTAFTPTNICYFSPGNYNVTLIATNSFGSDTLTLNNFITVYPFPPTLNIVQSGDTLFATTGLNSYQWYYNTTLINGATNSYYIATQSGDYNVSCTDANGCNTEAGIFNVIAGIQQISSEDAQDIRLYPNPVSGELLIQVNQLSIGNMAVSIFNVLGEKVLVPDIVRTSVEQVNSGQQQEVVVDVSSLSSGIYFLELYNGSVTSRARFIKK